MHYILMLSVHLFILLNQNEPSNQEKLIFFTIWMLGTLLFLIVGSLILLLFKRDNNTWKEILDEFVPYHPIKYETRSCLEEFFPYYKNLSYADKNEFEKRTQRFINTKTFHGRQTLKEVDYKIKVLVAATAIQISFGFKSFRFMHFKNILIYPDGYYSHVRRQYHYGEVNSAGMIVLSAKRFIDDIFNSSDGINLGLHEFAHALFIENKILDVDNRFLDQASLDEFEEMGIREMKKIKSGESQFFRKYGGINLFEFFSVCVELFFETPNAMKSEARNIYLLLCRILKQDPSSNDVRAIA